MALLPLSQLSSFMIFEVNNKLKKVFMLIRLLFAKDICLRSFLKAGQYRKASIFKNGLFSGKAFKLKDVLSVK